MDQYFTKLSTRVECLVFSDSQCIYIRLFHHEGRHDRI